MANLAQLFHTWKSCCGKDNYLSEIAIGEMTKRTNFFHHATDILPRMKDEAHFLTSMANVINQTQIN